MYRVSDVVKNEHPKKEKSGAARFSKVLRPAVLLGPQCSSARARSAPARSAPARSAPVRVHP